MKQMFKNIKKVPSEPAPPVHVDVPPILPEVLVQQDSIPQPPETPPIVNRIPAADLLALFLKEHNIRLTPTVMTEQCSIIDGGIVLNDKPLVKIAVEYRT